MQPVLCNVTVAMSLLFHCGAAFNVRQWNSVFTRSDELRGKKSYHHFEVTESGVAFYNGTCHACNTYSHAPNVAAAGTTLLRLHASDDVTICINDELLIHKSQLLYIRGCPIATSP